MNRGIDIDGRFGAVLIEVANSAALLAVIRGHVVAGRDAIRAFAVDLKFGHGPVRKIDQIRHGADEAPFGLDCGVTRLSEALAIVCLAEGSFGREHPIALPLHEIAQLALTETHRETTVVRRAPLPGFQRPDPCFGGLPPCVALRKIAGENGLAAFGLQEAAVTITKSAVSSDIRQAKIEVLRTPESRNFAHCYARFGQGISDGPPLFRGITAQTSRFIRPDARCGCPTFPSQGKQVYRPYCKTRNSWCVTTLKLSDTWLRKDFHSFGMVSRKNLRIAPANCFCVG